MLVLLLTEEYGIITKEVSHLNQFDGTDTHAIQVLKSAAGYYIGILYKDTQLNGYYPDDRYSHYYNTRDEAEIAIKDGSYYNRY
jgi:hypothetical protein